MPVGTSADGSRRSSGGSAVVSVRSSFRARSADSRTASAVFAIVSPQRRKYSEVGAGEQADKIIGILALRRLAAALTYRDFRVLWIGALASSIGTWMQKVAQSWLVLTLTGASSAFYLGLDSFLGELPLLVFTLIGGVVADRYDRRRLLLMSQAIQMAAAFTLAALVYFDLVQLWQ